MSRAILMAVAAGLLLFLWQGLANVAMPWAGAPLAGFEDEARVRDVLLEEAPRPGVYFVPFHEEPSPGEPAMLVAVQHNGPLPFVASAAGQIAGNILALLMAVVFLLRTTVSGYLQRTSLVASVGLAAWIVGSLPHFLWWGISASFVGVELLNTLVGWSLAGAFLVLLVDKSGPDDALASSRGEV